MNGRGRYLPLTAYEGFRRSPDFKTLSQTQNLYPGRPYPIGFGFGIPGENGYEELYDRRRLYEKNYNHWLTETTMADGLPQQPARPAVDPQTAFQNPNTFAKLINLRD